MLAEVQSVSCSVPVQVREETCKGNAMKLANRFQTSRLATHIRIRISCLQMPKGLWALDNSSAHIAKRRSDATQPKIYHLRLWTPSSEQGKNANHSWS
jgi:hypothetical protein